MRNSSTAQTRADSKIVCVTFQYRDDRHTHVAQRGRRRWVDRGLGSRYGEIYDRCQSLATTHLNKNVAARTLVISPEILFMQALPAERRVAVLAELTESAVDRWFETLDLPTAEHSYVIHRGESKHERPDGTIKDMPAGGEFLHSHVVLAATVPGLQQEREPYWVGKQQIPLLHEVARLEMERIWTRELGHERVLELNAELEAKTQQLEQLDQERTQPVTREVLEDLYRTLGFEPPDDLNLSLGRGQDELGISR